MKPKLLLAFHGNLQPTYLSNFPAVSAEVSGKCGALWSLGSDQGMIRSPQEPESRVPPPNPPLSEGTEECCSGSLELQQLMVFTVWLCHDWFLPSALKLGLFIALNGMVFILATSQMAQQMLTLAVALPRRSVSLWSRRSRWRDVSDVAFWQWRETHHLKYSLSVLAR